ncbi:YebC/PmpR family DNA-binding transcriptional regulator [Desulforamulus aeronauticus]|uniref:Probable transcriptional regulatory protein SAMN02745123_00228 n=1 Tax=Desulforamulus aeronauticus DSM 10349 TaxID=1121421 RepID=A0A1M6NN53_9FIRM|nr:YebC/PmpR family DNA-binding transcriptional regulator [Desulforamulus aeronauticus]SHJ96992.1 DNA-binding regulatory protein, YebC/PmpR family [Desulforamulus aeronauticus DSM 10349]
MSGHSKWATIKRKKAKVDSQRGKVFTRISKEIIIAARNGGGDPVGNMRLKAAIEKAKAANIPNDNIQRAIQKGVGGGEGANFEEFSYEGYGPGGVAILLHVATDNRNRTAGEVRHILSKHGGNLGETGCVGWMFKEQGVIIIDRSETKLSEDEMMLTALDAGAEDVKVEEDSFEIITEPEEFPTVKAALLEQGVPVADAEITMVPQTTVKIVGEEAEKMIKMIDLLEDNDDVQAVYTNFELEE